MPALISNGNGNAVSYDEKTAPQIFSTVEEIEEVELTKDTTTSGQFYDKVKLMRKHPTVKLARALSIAPLLAAQWSIESNNNAPDGAKEFIHDDVLPLRIHLLRSSLQGCSDYGWQPYEKVFRVREVGEFSGKIGIKKIKSLLQPKTKVLVDGNTGSFVGLLNEVSEPAVTLHTAESLLVNIDVEGTDWYGIPDMAAVEPAYNEWKVTNGANVKFDKKMAGAHWIIHYPPGKALFNGVLQDNETTAKALLNSLESSGSFVVPRVVEGFIDDLNKDNTAWKIELISAYPTANVAFIDRLKYLDSMLVRAYGLPERAVLEGQFGTKAEAEAHADFAITNMELRHQFMVQQYNWHLVNQLLRLNYGPESENTVWISVAPITDLAMIYLRSLYTAILSNSEGFNAEADNIDRKALRDKLSIPSISAEQREMLDEEEMDNALTNFTKGLVPSTE